MKNKIEYGILVLILVVGLSLLVYPTFSNRWNAKHGTRAIADYNETVENMSEDKYQEILEQAQEYNQNLVGKNGRFILSEEQTKEYKKLLQVEENGPMGYVEIPMIDVELPIYHGVESKILDTAIGHIPGSSLPVGGTGTHCVISGHRGLPSAKLFTNLDQMKEGDIFMLHTLNMTLTYEVDQILIVLPDELGPLAIDPEKDYCSLITCTPYGVNTHRLIVRGHRVENRADLMTKVTADALQVEPILVAPAIAVPILLIMFLWLIIRDYYRRFKRRKNKGRGEADEKKNSVH